MPYSAVADIRDALDEAVLIYLTDDEGAGLVDEDRVTAAIAAADAEIEGYCQKRYDLPFDPVPAIIRTLSVDIAVYKLFTRRGFREDSADKAVAEKYKNAVRMLKDIASGVLQIGTGATPHPAPRQVLTRTRTKLFSEDELDKY